MSSAVAELEAGLQAMLTLKPPGVSGSKISNLTALCTANIQSESVLIQKLYTHFKRAPGTHKLGVLYVVDSVTRKWTEQAKALGQPITASAQDGTFGAGVHRVKELLPVLMNDITTSAPEDQKDKIRKLIEIWEKGMTFPADMLKRFKDMLNKSTTPEGSPPPGVAATYYPSQSAAAAQPAATAQNTSSILEALANMARQNSAATAAPTAATAAPNVSASVSAPAQNIPYSMLSAQRNGSGSQHVAPLNPPNIYPPTAQSVIQPATLAAAFNAPQSNGAQNYPSNPSMPSGAGAAAVPPPAMNFNPDLQRQVMLLKTLADAGVPQDQWGGIIAALTQAGPAMANGANAAMSPAAGQYAGGTMNQTAPPAWAPRPDESRDRNGLGQNMRSPQGQGRFRGRSRSPSPNRAWKPRDSPDSYRRGDPQYGDIGQNSPGYGRDDARGRQNEYRQRSPMRRGRSPSPPRGFYDGRSGGEKWVDFDPTIPKGSIKVLSRTLFVGGVTCTDQELRRIFAQFGKVQTCIVNKEKRHAFVKMVSRNDAVTAKDAMESNRGPETAGRIRSTRWGVGFGPRDCSDYQTGISIIPVTKLTDADRKWLLTAEYGGSGGKPIESGMVVEEPDIEIGQGVSSKAISRRVGTDRGGQNGPRSGREHDEDEFRRDRRRDDDRSSVTASMNMGNVSTMPQYNPYAMPPMANGMPMFPPGFVFPGQAAQQPPPPGRG